MRVSMSWLYSVSMALLVSQIGRAEGRAPDIEPKVKETIEKMVQFFEGTDNLTFKAMTITEDVSSTLQKLQFDSTIEGALQRPNKVYFKKSGHEQTTLWYDGATATIFDRKANRYAKIAISGTMRELLEKLDALGIETPFAGLLDKSILKHVEDHVFKGDYYGPTEIDGTQTIHMAMRQDSVDWQLWTDAKSAAPKKLVITSKMLAGAPEHMLFIKEVMRVAEPLKPETFQPVIPVGAVEVPIQSDESETIRNSSW